MVSISEERRERIECLQVHRDALGGTRGHRCVFEFLPRFFAVGFERKTMNIYMFASRFDAARGIFTNINIVSEDFAWRNNDLLYPRTERCPANAIRQIREVRLEWFRGFESRRLLNRGYMCGSKDWYAYRHVVDLC